MQDPDRERRRMQPHDLQAVQTGVLFQMQEGLQTGGEQVQQRL